MLSLETIVIVIYVAALNSFTCEVSRSDAVQWHKIMFIYIVSQRTGLFLKDCNYRIC